MICSNCQREKPASQFRADSYSPDVCFRCRVSSIGFTNPIKSGQGDDQWRHSTLKEWQRNQVAEGRANGLDPIPAWHNTNTGNTTSGGMKKLQKALKKDG